MCEQEKRARLIDQISGIGAGKILSIPSHDERAQPNRSSNMIFNAG